MSSVSMMTDTDNKMMSLAVVHGVKAPSQTSHAVGGLAGASEASGALTPLLKPISGLSDFLADYIDSKNRFEAELRTTLQEARKAAASMETMEYAQAERKERTTEAAEAVSEPKMDKDSVGTVETFADRYNNLTEFLKENKTGKVLVEEKNGEYFEGYTQNYIKCYFKEKCNVGDVVDVEIIKPFKDGVLAKKC